MLSQRTRYTIRALLHLADRYGEGPVQLTDQGKELHAKVRERVVSITKRLLADFDRADLETTRRVLVELVERAKTV